MDYPEEYLEFLRLYAKGCYFKCHDVLEELWHSDGQDFYKGLIQVAVAMHHLEGGNWKGCYLLMESAEVLLRPYGEVYMGLELAPLRQVLARGAAEIKARPRSFDEAREAGLLPMELSFVGDLGKGKGFIKPDKGDDDGK